MSKDAAEPADPAPPSTGPIGRSSGTERVKGGSEPRRERSLLEEFAQRLGEIAAREALRRSCIAPLPELLFAPARPPQHGASVALISIAPFLTRISGTLSGSKPDKWREIGVITMGGGCVETLCRATLPAVPGV